MAPFESRRKLFTITEEVFGRAYSLVLRFKDMYKNYKIHVYFYTIFMKSCETNSNKLQKLLLTPHS